MSDELMRQNMAVVAQAYANAKNLALTTVSKRFHGSSSFLTRYIAGASSPTIRQYFAILGRLREDWPKGVKWPRTAPIPRFELTVGEVVAPPRARVGREKPAARRAKTGGKKSTKMDADPMR